VSALASDARAWAVLGTLLSLGAAQRIWNALQYPVTMSFDFTGKLYYIQLLLRDFALPAPDAGWSTAHPPLFYALAAGIGRLQSEPSIESVTLPVVLLSAGIGLVAIALTARLAFRLSGGSHLRSALAAALLLFLPVHVMMSAMLSEEILVSALVTFALVGLVAELHRPPSEASSLRAPAWLGALAGLGLLTKLGAAIFVGVATLTLLAEGRRREPRRALAAAAVFAGAATVTGGWFYLRNLVFYGYVYPQGLPAHELMFEMPPGTRGLGDYVTFPLATFSAAQMVDAPLLRSVWAGTYASLWFDPHRHFLPKTAPGLELAARILLWTALLPTLAFLVGLWRGAGRAWRGSGSDRLLTGLVLGMLAAYVAFTARNPWFATVKGSYLLTLATPFAVYASETLERWLRAGRLRAVVVATTLVVLFTASAITFNSGGLFPKREAPGVDWRIPK
jgi:hypothetical protein